MSENIIQYVNAAAAGDTDAMAKLYSKTLKGSYFLATKLCTVEEQAINITKAAYARAFSNIDKLKKPEAFEIWMKQNVAAVYKEGVKFVYGDADAGAQEMSSEFLPEDILESEEKIEIIDKAVSSLKPELKTAIILHYNNGMPVPALAKFLGVSESTANALLGKARAEILSLSGMDAKPSELSGTLPVLTRIFQKLAVETKIENSAVRDIFIYAIDAYENSRPVVAAPAVFEEKETAEINEESAQENLSEQAAVSDNVIDFKQKINEILSASAPSSENAEEKEETEAEPEAVVPEFKAPVVSAPSNEPFMARNHESIATQPQKKFNLNKKTLVIIAAAILALIVICFGIGKLASGNDDPAGTTDNNITIENNEVSATSKWVAGGFAECSEIEYLDENCAVFKSVTTGKYGLIDYEGKVILQPNYDGFVRCGNGKDYTGRNSYHSLVVIGNQNFEFSVNNGVVTISDTPHGSHGVEADPLGDKSYDERDRYYNGYAAARKDGLWGYVSQDKDKRVIKYQYEAVNDLESYEASACDYCRPVSDNGLIPVKKDGMMGIINLDNDIFAEFEYTDILPGKNGVFIACKAGTWGVILTGNAIKSFAGVNLSVQNTPSDVPNADDPAEGRFVVISEDGVNVRSGAGSDFDLLGELSEGDIVDGYSIKTVENGKKWLCIKYKGEYGWVSMNMLEPDGI